MNRSVVNQTPQWQPLCWSVVSLCLGQSPTTWLCFFWRPSLFGLRNVLPDDWDWLQTPNPDLIIQNFTQGEPVYFPVESEIHLPTVLKAVLACGSFDDQDRAALLAHYAQAIDAWDGRAMRGFCQEHQERRNAEAFQKWMKKLMYQIQQ